MIELNYKNIIDNIINLASDKLNEWEAEFIDTIYVKFVISYGKYKLTDKQKSCIRGIQDKYLKHN